MCICGHSGKRTGPVHWGSVYTSLAGYKDQTMVIICWSSYTIVMFGFLPHEAQPPGPCWFCLASPEVEKHLVVNIGTHVSYFYESFTEEIPVCFLFTLLNHNLRIKFTHLSVQFSSF